jgi:phage-related minor tail protein
VFGELQNLKSNEASKLLDSLKTQFDQGTISGAQYESALVGIMDQYREFPKVVQMSVDALQQFRQAQELAVATTKIQLSSALQEATKDFAELEGKGILGAVDGFLRAAVSGENFGDSLKRLGEDIIYTTLRMLILKQIMSMFGLSGSGGNGGLSFMGSALGAMGVPGMGGYAFAQGGVLERGIRLKKYASGGVVSEPTFFPMKRGMGLMGEQYKPEGIFPLQRMSNGDLGVQAIVPQTQQEAPQVIVNVENKTTTPVKADNVKFSYDDMKRLMVSVVLEDQATNGPITRNYRR